MHEWIVEILQTENLQDAANRIDDMARSGQIGKRDISGWKKRIEKSADLIEFDKRMLSFGGQYVAGVDEVGRGPLAGPIVAAAVIMDMSKPIVGIDDSKKIKHDLRTELYKIIRERALSIRIKAVQAPEIDKIGIQKANIKVMTEALRDLKLQPDVLLSDGFHLFVEGHPTTKIIRGDSQSYAIACASITAKVIRDRLMACYALKVDDRFGYEHNAGYGTAEHMLMLEKYGPTRFHRKSFLKSIYNG